MRTETNKFWLEKRRLWAIMRKVAQKLFQIQQVQDRRYTYMPVCYKTSSQKLLRLDSVCTRFALSRARLIT